EVEVGDAGPPQHRGGVRGAAAEPGAGGDALVDHDVGAAPGRGQGPAHEVVVVDLHAGADAPHVEAVAGGVDRQRVGQVEADHLGVDQVVPVGAHAGHPQRQGQLGGGGDDDGHGGRAY